MPASECCIFRAVVAAFAGAIVGVVSLWDHGLLVALGLSPVFGSAGAMGSVAAFWAVGLLVPCRPVEGAVE